MSKPPRSQVYLRIKRQYPDFIQAIDGLGKAVRKAGPLNEKTAHLIQLGAAAAIRSEGAVHSHARRALEAGATQDEVRHALLVVASTIGFPNVVAAFSWAEDVLKKK